MPRLWNDTIEAHRHDVRDAVMDATASIVAAQGLLSVTMSRVAEESGIGRATLYKYFPDVEAILLAWHERHVVQHLDQIGAIARRLLARFTGTVQITGNVADRGIELRHGNSETIGRTLIHGQALTPERPVRQPGNCAPTP